MAIVEPIYVLEVVGGEDHGARLVLDGDARTIGRAKDADLVLRDLAVSRRHVQAAVGDGFVSFVLCAGASPFVVDGMPRRSFEAKIGDRLLIGNTLVIIASAGRSDSDSAAAPARRTDVRTLLTGAAADVRGLAGLHALIEALDSIEAVDGLEPVLKGWASEHLGAADVAVTSASESDANAQLEELPLADDKTRLSAPAPSDEPLRLVVTLPIASARVTDSMRRSLVLAGRLLGSSRARVHRQGVALGEVSALRALSVGSAHSFLGSSDAAAKLAALIPRLAKGNASVLIEGETGVGKTFVARLIHEASERAKEPLRVLNCAAIPESLIESELFGHERGAFTGAIATRAGAFESAGRGTVLLDELGELTLQSQAKLLRVLEERRFERVGGNKAIELRARIICATNRDLETMANEGRFRRDLLFRVKVLTLRVPPLRERAEDLMLLAEQLLRDAAQSAGRRISGFDASAASAIRSYGWPGNVRELRNAIEHAVALGDGPVVEPRDLPAGIAAASPQPEDSDMVRLPLALADVERRAIESALRATNGNRVRAAALLGINRQTLYNKLREYGVS